MLNIKDDLKCVLRILSAHNKNNSRGATVGIGPKILNAIVFFKVIDACGNVEQGEKRGVAREVITEFWQLFYQSLSVGAATKVPVIKHDYQKQEWKPVARILLHGYCKDRIYLMALSSAFMACTILGEECISSHVLLKAFLAYVSDNERVLINESLGKQSKIANNVVFHFKM